MKQIVLSLLCVVACSSMLWAQATVAPQATTETNLDQMKRTVVFLETHWLDSTAHEMGGQGGLPQRKSIVGTGFLIFVQIPELGKDSDGNGLGLDYLVTTKHMIRQQTAGQAGPYAKDVTVRFNTVKPVDSTGKRWDTFDSDIVDPRGDLQWIVDDSDPVADVALIPVFLGQNADYKTIGPDFFATKELDARQHFDENDEVLFTGLFTGYFGAQKNYPIVRHGKLALLPGEDVAIDPAKPDKKSQIYLAEVTSFGGNSGSPVFLRTTPLRESVNVKRELGYNYYLLGVMKGFVSDQEAKQNSGIALVVPVDKIVEILSGDRVRAHVARAIAKARVSQGDFKGGEVKLREAIAILEGRAPESSQLVATLRDYAALLTASRRGDEARAMLTRAQGIADRPVSKVPEP